MHTRTTALAAGLLFLLGLTAAAVSAVPAKDFEGTRADVRAFCERSDSFLLEGGSYSLCVTGDNDVVCHDDGLCASSNLSLLLADGFRDVLVAETPATIEPRGTK